VYAFFEVSAVFDTEVRIPNTSDSLVVTVKMKTMVDSVRMPFLPFQII